MTAFLPAAIAQLDEQNSVLSSESHDVCIEVDTVFAELMKARGVAKELQSRADRQAGELQAAMEKVRSESASTIRNKANNNLIDTCR